MKVRMTKVKRATKVRMESHKFDNDNDNNESISEGKYEMDKNDKGDEYSGEDYSANSDKFQNENQESETFKDDEDGETYQVAPYCNVAEILMTQPLLCARAS